MYKGYIEDLEKKLSVQINEMGSFQQSLYDLERIHQQMKQQYEDEIMRLRALLDPKRKIENPRHVEKRRDSDVSMPRKNMKMDMDRERQLDRAIVDIRAERLPERDHRDIDMKVMDNRDKERLIEQNRSQQQPIQEPQTEWKAKPEEWLVKSNPSHAFLQSSGIEFELIHSLEHGSVVCCVKFSPDGKYLATGCNHYAQIFDVSSGRSIWYCKLMKCYAR
jgi:glucose repression regulatory protein TUP1